MFVQRKTTELYQNLHNSLVGWKEFTPNNEKEQKPFFILLTHPHCMWTAKLCAEAFTNQTIVDVLQEHFTPCIIDKHIDPEIYILMNQSLRIFLKDQNIRPGCIFTHKTGEPFLGGGYHPPSPRYGMPSFIQFLHHAIRLIDQDTNIAPILLRHNTPPKTPFSWCYSWDKRIDTGYADAFDFMNHGFDIAPKYLNTARLKSWLSFPARKHTVVETVKTIATAPILDPINGCVYRKCEDALWDLPVREALLDDQAEFTSLMMQTLPDTPCTSFLLKNILKQYKLENGLFSQSISYLPPTTSSLPFLQWKEESPHFSKLPSAEECTKLLETTTPNIAHKDHRAVCSSNARLLKTLIQNHVQSPKEETKQQIIALEQSIWAHFGWKETKEWFHTAEQNIYATGSDLALLIQALISLQGWSPEPTRQKELLSLVDYWESRYVHNGICYTHPQERFFQRGVDLIAENHASAQEEAAYTLTLLSRAGIPTKNNARSFIHNQQWLIFKNPKILSTALSAWRQITPPIYDETHKKTILAFEIHNPLSHQFLDYIQSLNFVLWAQCKTSQQFLTQKGYAQSVIQSVSWDICNQQGQLHTGPIHPQDIEHFLGWTRSEPKERLISAFCHKNERYLHFTYTIKRMDGPVLLSSSSPILCFCFCEDTYWWITPGKLHSSTSDTPHTLPSPLTSPISLSMHHGSLLITQREDLWLFHISQERFGRYAGKSGVQQKDGLIHSAVFQNITSTYTHEKHILICDAYKLRIIDTQQHMVQTLDDHPSFLYASSIIMFNKKIYIADCVQQCVWQYSLEQENTKKWACRDPKSMYTHNDTLWVLSHDRVIELKSEYF